MKDEIRDLIERVAEVEASKEELSKFNKFNFKKSFNFYIYLNSFAQMEYHIVSDRRGFVTLLII